MLKKHVLVRLCFSCLVYLEGFFFFRAPEKKKDCPFFFSVWQNRPEASTFSLPERVDLRSQKEGISGKKLTWGRAGWTGQKEGKKDAQKKVGFGGFSYSVAGPRAHKARRL